MKAFASVKMAVAAWPNVKGWLVLSWKFTSMTSVDWLPMAPGTTTGLDVPVGGELLAFGEYGLASLEDRDVSPEYAVTPASSIVLPTSVPSTLTRLPVNMEVSGGVLR